MFGLPMLAVLAIFAKPIIRVWAGAAAVPSTSLIVGLTLYTALGIALMTVGQLLVGLERVNALALSLVLCSLGIIGASILVAPQVGIGGHRLLHGGRSRWLPIGLSSSGNCGVSSARRTSHSSIRDGACSIKK